MLNDILIALIYDILKFLSSNKDFFQKSDDEKSKLLEESTLLPNEFNAFLIGLNEKELFQEIKEILDFVSSHDENHSVKSELAKAFSLFCINQVPKDLDNYTPDQPNVFTGKFGKHLGILYASTVEKQVIDLFQSFISMVFDSPFIVVQTPILLDKEQKQTIRSEIQSNHPHSIPTFSVNKNLIGGLRVFINGKTHDHSWISKINNLTSLTNTN